MKASALVRCATALAVLALSACASVAPLEHKFEAPPLTEVGAEQGLAVWTLSINSDSLRVSLLDWKVEVQPAAGGAALPVYGRRDLLTDSTLFVAALPPGRYRIGKMEAALFDKSSSAGNGPAAVFEVQAGHLSFLGGLSFPPKSDSKAAQPDAGIRQMAEEINSLRSALPALNQSWPVIAGWLPSPELDAARAAFDSTRKTAYGFNKPIRSTSGRVYAGGTIGQVLSRSEQGQWQVLDTGVSRQILSVWASDSLLLAGGEAGLLRLSRDGGKSWANAPALPSPGPVLALNSLSNGEIVAAVTTGFTLNLYRNSSRLDRPWQLLGSFTLQGVSESAQPGILAQRVQLHSLPDGLALYTPVKKLAYYKAASNTWSGYEEPEAEQIQDFYAYADGSSYIVVNGKESNTVKRSTDGGVSWRELYTVAKWSSSLRYVAPKTAFKILSDRVRKLGDDGKEISKTVHRLYLTRDDGLSWTPYSNFPEGSAEFFALDDAASRFLTVLDRSLYFGPGDADKKPWKAEYPPSLVEQAAKEPKVIEGTATQPTP